MAGAVTAAGEAPTPQLLQEAPSGAAQRRADQKVNGTRADGRGSRGPTGLKQHPTPCARLTGRPGNGGNKRIDQNPLRAHQGPAWPLQGHVPRGLLPARWLWEPEALAARRHLMRVLSGAQSATGGNAEGSGEGHAPQSVTAESKVPRNSFSKPQR